MKFGYNEDTIDFKKLWGDAWAEIYAGKRRIFIDMNLSAGYMYVYYTVKGEYGSPNYLYYSDFDGSELSAFLMLILEKNKGV